METKRWSLAPQETFQPSLTFQQLGILITQRKSCEYRMRYGVGANLAQPASAQAEDFVYVQGAMGRPDFGLSTARFQHPIENGLPGLMGNGLQFLVSGEIQLRLTSIHPQESLQLVPPELPDAAEIAGREEKHRRGVIAFEQASSFVEVVGIPVVEGDGNPAASGTQPPAFRLNLSERNAPVSLEYLEVLGKVLGRDTQRPGISLRAGDPVVEKDDAAGLPSYQAHAVLAFVAATATVTG